MKQLKIKENHINKENIRKNCYEQLSHQYNKETNKRKIKLKEHRREEKEAKTTNKKGTS